MNLKDAKALRDYIKARGYHSIVPLGFGPDRYFAQIYGASGAITRFLDRAEFRKHHAMRLRQRRKSNRDYDAFLRATERRALSPIERMIDQACGLG